MGFELVTGHKGEAHVTSDQVGAFNAMIFGSGRYVLDVGDKFETELTGANTFNIKSGQLINQGRQMAIDFGDIETVTLDNGAQGLKRIDIVCAVYTNDTSSEIESGTIGVIKGTPAVDPAIPTYADKQGDILKGATSDYFPLFKVTMDGLAIATIEPMFTVTKNFAVAQGEALAQVNKDVADTISKANEDFAAERDAMQAEFDAKLAEWAAVESTQQVQKNTNNIAKISDYATKDGKSILPNFNVIIGGVFDDNTSDVKFEKLGGVCHVSAVVNALSSMSQAQGIGMVDIVNAPFPSNGKMPYCVAVCTNGDDTFKGMQIMANGTNARLSFTAKRGCTYSFDFVYFVNEDIGIE